MPFRESLPSDVVVAAGALVWREGEDGIEILLVHSPRYDEWSYPKGKVDAGESLPATAVREIAEETGWSVRLHQPLPTAVYLLPGGRTKIVRYWTATARAKTYGGPKNPREIDDVRWVPLPEARRMLIRQSHHVQLDALERFIATGTLRTNPIIIQRHAAALGRAKWRKGEETRPLNKKGKKQAKMLPQILSAFTPQRIVTSPWKRCDATMAHFAKLSGIDVRRKDSLTEAANEQRPSRTAAVMERILVGGNSCVVCTHRPVLPTLIEVAKQHATEEVARELPKKDPYLAAGEMLILHTTVKGLVVALERHISEP
ncbi:NUDIX hydrolase [Dermabacteraceae bacterium P13136]